MIEQKVTRILIAEDDTLVCEMIQGILEEMDYKVVGRAADGYQAIELTQKLEPDVVLMDIQLPGIDGIEAAIAINETRPTPIVALTAYDSPEILERVKASGIGSYLTKPPDVRQIDRAIAITIARFQDMMELRRLNNQLQQDIAKRKQMETRLRNAEKKSRHLIEQIGAVVYIDRNYKTSSSLYISPQAEKMFGYPNKLWETDKGLWKKIIHPDDFERVMTVNDHTNKSGEPLSIEYRIIRKDGKIIWVHDDAVLVKDDERKLPAWYGIMYDITDQKVTQDELKSTHSRLEKYNKRLAQILEIGNTFRINLDLDSLLYEITLLAKQAINYKVAVLNLLDPTGENFIVTTYSGINEEGENIFKGTSYPKEEVMKLMDPRFRVGECYFIPEGSLDWDKDFHGAYYSLPASEYRYILNGPTSWRPGDSLLAPIKARDGILTGCISLDLPEDGKRPQSDIIQTLAIFANQVAVAIENTRLYAQAQQELIERKQTEEKLRFLSTHDTLTGLYNRLYYEDECVRLEHSRQFPISIMMVDVNGLKAVNDRYGHDVGDNVLIDTAKVLREAFREGDIIARIGGDEFAVMLPRTSEDIARQVLERVYFCLNEYNRDHKSLPLSLSIGVATGERGMSPSYILKKADEAMYLNKKQSKIS